MGYIMKFLTLLCGFICAVEVEDWQGWKERKEGRKEGKEEREK